ncbi:MAG: DUF3106 domain-containing protein [Pseudoxanthomonas sp.]
MRSFEVRPASAVARTGNGVAFLIALLAVALMGPPSVLAQGAVSGTEMTQTQRGARLQAMTHEQLVQFGQRVAAWNALPAREREQRRSRYQSWSQLEAAERESLRALAAQVAAFPPERTQALRAQFDALDDVQRYGWRLGPTLGRDYAALHPLLGYVPLPQRQPLLARLRRMDAQQRIDLAVLAQRTPPQDRQALRNELLSVPLSEMTVWMRRKLDQ